MFDYKTWLMDALVNSYKKGQFSREYVIIKSTDYFVKGIFTADDLEEINTRLNEIDEQTSTEESEETTE